MNPPKAKKFSVLMGSYLLVSILVFSGGILGWTYFQANLAVEAELKNSFQQRSLVVETILERRLESIRFMLMEHSNRAFSESRAASDQDELNLELSHLKSTPGIQLDVLFLIRLDGNLWDDASTHFFNLDPVLPSIIEQVDSLEKGRIMRLGQKDTSLALILQAIPLIAPHSGEVLGTLIGGEILNDNLSLLDEIKRRTQSEEVAFFWQDQMLGTSGLKQSFHTAALRSANLHPNPGRIHLSEGDLEHGGASRVLSHVRPMDLNGIPSTLKIAFAIHDQSFSMLKTSFWWSGGVLLAASLVFLFFSHLLVRHLTLPPLSRLTHYANEVASGSPSPHYVSGNIEEFNLVGIAMEGMVDNLQASNEKLTLEIYDRKRIEMELKSHRDQLEEIVAARTQELESSNESLQSTISNLKTMQDQLIQSEKLAALGQLMAGVAHEINTPLGAISSSAAQINANLEKNLNELPQFLASLDKSLLPHFYQLIQTILANSEVLSMKERRTARKSMTARLKDQFGDQSAGFATQLINIRVFEEIEPFLPLLEAPNAKEILKMAEAISVIKRGTEIINSGAMRASKIVFALKNYSRVSPSGEKEKAQIQDGLKTVLALYANQIKYGVKLVQQFDPIPEIHCYFEELNQVWTNLIHNALYSMKNKGELTLSTHIEKEKIVVAIQDNGPGIPPQIVEKIFSPFFTTKPLGEGTGLGLDIVKRIVEKHNGDIFVESQPGNTKFTVLLPVES